MNGPNQESKTLHARILSGSVVLLSGSGLTTAISFAYNVAVARFLGPAGYGNAAAVYTLLTIISAVTLSFQIVSAKGVAQQELPEGKCAIYREFHRAAWSCGIMVAILLLVFQGAIASYLNLPSPILVVLLAVGAAFYVPLGSRRGYLQGVYGFRRLATNLIVEGAVRLGGSLVMIFAGYGVRGVIAANAAAVAVAYLAAGPRHKGSVAKLRFPHAFRETVQAMVFFAGQVLINNCDIVLVKHFFVPKAAGVYAAVAMVGRVIFTFSSAVVNSMFPLVAGTRDEERKDLRGIGTSLLLVFTIGSVLAIALRLAPAALWTMFFGAQFGEVGKYGLPYLLALYAVTTVIYSLSVVIVTYEMSYKIANTSWVQLAFSGLIVAGICRYHSSLQQVILVQLVLMIVLLGVVGIPFLMNALRDAGGLEQDPDSLPIRITGRISEDAVIAEFLKSDFKNPAFHEYRQSLRELVMAPNIEDAGENAKRRALLFIRHLALWKEIPSDTAWYEVEVRPSELRRIRVFPRAQWRKLARGEFAITEVVDRMRSQPAVVDGMFLSKIEAIRDCLLQGDADPGAVILIGLNESEPLTILDGNHRLVAAMLDSPRNVERLKFLCGLSPRMAECCWYNTNLKTLLRYGRNLATHVVRDPEAELARLLQMPG